MKKLAVFFPGIGYTADKPLLYYSRKLAAELDYEVLSLSYGGFPKKPKGDPEKLRACFRLAAEQAAVAGNPADPAAAEQSGERESYLYVAYNLHWEKRELALPALPSGREWRVVIDTSVDRFSGKEDAACLDAALEKGRSVLMPGRSIRVLVG